MKKLAIATFVAGLMGSTAFADGIPTYGKTKAPPQISWSTDADWRGLYTGVHGGWHDGNDGSIGGLIGYNWQAGKLVLGVEADFLKLFDGENITKGTIDEGEGFSRDWYASFRGHIGYATGPWLPYLTGGWAIGKATAFNLDGGVWDNPVSITPSGLVWGGGLKVRVFEPVSLDLSFKRYEFGDYDINVNGNDRSVNLTDNVVSLAIIYKF